MHRLKAVLVSAIAVSLLMPGAASAQSTPKRIPKIIVYPNYPHPAYGKYGFLPGYRQPPALSDWRDRSVLYGGPRPKFEPRYWSSGEWRYGWGGPGFYRGQYNGGTIGPCYTQTPIGPIWNCGM